MAALAGVGAVAGLGAPDALAQSSPPEAVNSSFVVGLAPGVGFYKGKLGPWFEVFLGKDFLLTERVGVRAEVSGVFAQYRDQDSYQVIGSGDVDFTDRVQGVGGIARGLLEVGVSPSWSLRGGLLVGFAHTSLDSSLCTATSVNGPFIGLSAGAALRFGAARQLELGVLGDLAGFPLLGCATTQPVPSVRQRTELGLDDPTLAASARLGYHW